MRLHAAYTLTQPVNTGQPQLISDFRFPIEDFQNCQSKLLNPKLDIPACRSKPRPAWRSAAACCLLSYTSPQLQNVFPQKGDKNTSKLVHRSRGLGLKSGVTHLMSKTAECRKKTT
jgi:hypothetical protein